MDNYTTMPWPALCAEVVKAQISFGEGKLLEMPMPMAVAGASALAAPLLQCWNPLL